MREYMLFFMPGSQGRFLASVLWALLNDVNVNNRPTSLNAWHGEIGRGYVNTVTNLPDYTGPTFYHDLRWKHDNNFALYRSHYYPNWEQLASIDRFNNTKFIVIHIDPEDLTECLVNEMYKNTYKTIKGMEKTIDNHLGDTIYKIYQEHFGPTTYENFVRNLNPDFMQDIIQDSRKTYLNFLQESPTEEQRINYIFTEIPDFVADRTLVINFRDLYTQTPNGWLALDKLMSFTQTTPSPAVMDNLCYNFSINYKKRRAFVREYLYKLDITL